MEPPEGQPEEQPQELPEEQPAQAPAPDRSLGFDLTMPRSSIFDDCCHTTGPAATSPAASSSTGRASSTSAVALEFSPPAAAIETGYTHPMGAWKRGEGQRAKCFRRELFAEDGHVMGKWGDEKHKVEGVSVDDLTLIERDNDARKLRETSVRFRQEVEGGEVTVRIKGDKNASNQTGFKICIQKNSEHLAQTVVPNWHVLDALVGKMIVLAQKYITENLSRDQLRDEKLKLIASG